MKSLEELRKISLELDIRSSSLSKAIKDKDDSDTAQVSLVLRVSAWKQLLLIMAYNQEVGRRNFHTISSTIWQLVERSYKGILKKLKDSPSPYSEEAEDGNPDEPKTLDEAIEIIRRLKGKNDTSGGGREEIFPDFSDL